MTTTEWLHRGTRLRVDHHDETAFGGSIGPRMEQSLRAVFASALHLLEDGAPGDDPEVLRALHEGVRSNGYGALAEVVDAPDDLSWSVRKGVRCPDPRSIEPRHLIVTAPGGVELEARLPAGHWRPAHELVAGLNSPDGLPRGAAADLHPDMAAMLAGLRDLGALTTEPLQPVDAIDARPGLTFLGHNAALVRGDEGAVLVDPFLPRPSPSYPDTYQPITCDQLGAVDLILLTHGHPDHFDPGSLLRFPVTTPIVVPVVDRETLLAPDLATRVAQLGFTDVRPCPWGSRQQAGDVTVDVLAFYGEQPTDSQRLHTEIVNAGNTYVVRTPRQSFAFVADGGRDDRGSIAEVGARYASDHGSVDTVFAGYRGWRTTPAELLRSSVGRFFLFVPPELWARSMDLMNDAAGALQTATAFGASTLVPYADGGAPWFWELGLGPRLDETPLERPGFDPFPERVVEAANQMANAPDVLLLRPGQRIGPDGRVTELAGHEWPWPPVLIP